MPTFETILYDVADGIATITLNRPERLNAFTTQMMVDMIAAFDATDADDDVRAVIVTGAGRGFCAGADLAGGGDTFDRNTRQEAAREEGRVGGRRARRRRPAHLAHLREPEAGDRRVQRPGGGRRRHHAAGHGHPPGLHRGALRLRLRPARAQSGGGVAPGSCRTWSGRRPRWSGASPAASSPPRRPTRRAWCARCMRRTSCCRPLAHWPARSPTTPRRSRSPSPAS